MKTKFVYALALSIALAVFNLLLFLTGFQTEKLAVGQQLSRLTWLIQAAVLWFGIRAVREAAPNKALAYGQGVGAGVLISLYAGLMSGVYNFIHFTFINPDFADNQILLLREKWAALGRSAAQMDQAEAIARKLMSPVVFAVATPFVLVALGAIIALILAAILKRPAPSGLPAEPVASS